MHAFSICQGEQQYFMKSKSYPLSLLNNSLSHWGNRNESNRYFTSYYVELSKLMMSHVKRRLFIHGFNGDLKSATEDLWAEVFQKHRLQIFNTRPESAERLKALIKSLEPPSHGDLFKHETEIWIKEIDVGIQKVMEFLGQSAVSENDETLEQRAKEVNNELHALRQQGYGFLSQLFQYEGNYQADTELDEDSVTLEMSDDVVLGELAEGNNTHEADRDAFKQRIATLKKIIKAGGEAAADKKMGCTGAANFCLTMGEILSQIPKILIPTIPMLNTLINWKTIDFIRRFSINPLGSLSEPKNSDTNEQDESIVRDFIKPEQEKWGFWRDIQTLLQKPLIEAEALLNKPELTMRQRKQAEARLQRCENRYIVHMAISECIAKGCTQEGTASELGLTRDQVRYGLKEMQNLLKDLKDKIESERKHDE